MEKYSFLNESTLLESGIFLSKGCNIEVPPADDGDCPHIHITNYNWGGFICVRLDTNRYFSHGKWKDKFKDRKAKNAFDSFLRQLYKKNINNEITNYMYLVNEWNRNHIRLFQSRPNLRITDFTQPNYMLLDDRFDR